MCQYGKDSGHELENWQFQGKLARECLTNQGIVAPEVMITP